jgi:hypothetical protein
MVRKESEQRELVGPSPEEMTLPGYKLAGMWAVFRAFV